MNFPSHLKYTKDHEWARVDGKMVTIGITDHAQSALGDVVYVELPPIGRALKKGETFGVVESIKAVSDLYSPVSGKVLEVNAGLPDDPALINRSPYDSWIVRVELSDISTLGELMDASAYSSYVQSLGK